MNRPNEIMTVRGFDLTHTLSDIKREQPRSDVSTGFHFGMPVTTPAFLRMLFDFWLTLTNQGNPSFKDVWFVDFSKASLFRILSQEDCEFVRMYFVIPETGIDRASIGLEGIDAAGQPMKIEDILAVADTMNEETKEDIETSGQLQDILSLGTQPAHEEKGNGGPPLLGPNNVGSLVGFLSSKGSTLTQGSFRDFVEAYYKYAREAFI